MAGVYWRGADGNVYVQGDQGTNSAGAYDNNTQDYWNSRGYNQIVDPTRPIGGDSGAYDQTTGTWMDTDGGVLGSSTNTPGLAGGGSGSAEDVSFLNDQEAKLRGLLGRTDTNLNQGLQKNEDSYNTEVSGATSQKDAQVRTQNQNKQNAYDTIDRNAGNGYRSLAQIIGRSAGTGSSAFRDLLPNVIGKDTSSKRFDQTNTFGQNLSNIDTSFESVLADLLKQKKANEESVRTGVEGQRQDLNSKLAEIAAKRAQAQGGGYAQVKAAQAPFDQAIENSRNSVESFFNQFRTPYTPQAVNPNLAAYQVDRSAVNAQGQGQDPNNPYASLLRKKLQERA